MTQVNIDEELYKQVSEFVKKERIEYPSIINFIERAVKDKLRIELISQKETEQND
jgi:hypothetical protein